jgi:hypothetical protein
MRSIIKKNYVWLILVLMAFMALLAGFFFPAGEAEHGFRGSNINGFFAVLGFVGCIAIVYIAKWLGRWLKRKEDYYD